MQLLSISSIFPCDGKAHGKKIAYVVVDKMFKRDVLTKFSWTGLSKTKTKSSFVALRKVNKLIYLIVQKNDNRYCESNHEDFMKNCVLKYSESRKEQTGNKPSAPRTSTKRV